MYCLPSSQPALPRTVTYSLSGQAQAPRRWLHDGVSPAFQKRRKASGGGGGKVAAGGGRRRGMAAAVRAEMAEALDQMDEEGDSGLDVDGTGVWGRADTVGAETSGWTSRAWMGRSSRGEAGDPGWAVEAVLAASLQSAAEQEEAQLAAALAASAAEGEDRADAGASPTAGAEEPVSAVGKQVEFICTGHEIDPGDYECEVLMDGRATTTRSQARTVTCSRKQAQARVPDRAGRGRRRHIAAAVRAEMAEALDQMDEEGDGGLDMLNGQPGVWGRADTVGAETSGWTARAWMGRSSRGEAGDPGWAVEAALEASLQSAAEWEEAQLAAALAASAAEGEDRADAGASPTAGAEEPVSAVGKQVEFICTGHEIDPGDYECEVLMDGRATTTRSQARTVTCSRKQAQARVPDRAGRGRRRHIAAAVRAEMAEALDQMDEEGDGGLDMLNGQPGVWGRADTVGAETSGWTARAWMGRSSRGEAGDPGWAVEAALEASLQSAAEWEEAQLAAALAASAAEGEAGADNAGASRRAGEALPAVAMPDLASVGGDLESSDTNTDDGWEVFSHGRAPSLGSWAGVGRDGDWVDSDGRSESDRDDDDWEELESPEQ